jgi:hypothetical protein
MDLLGSRLGELFELRFDDVGLEFVATAAAVVVAVVDT